MKQNYKSYSLALNASSEVVSWIGSNLVNYLKSNPEDQEDIEHIIDYLVSDEAPTKNLSAMSYGDAHKNAERWTKKLIKKGEHIKELPSDTETVLDFKDGFKIVKLKGKNAYEREGYLMRHCVGSYYGSSKEIYSLRDENNTPHCTMEKDQQVKGKGNGNIHPKYVGYVVKFLEHVGMTVGDSEMKHLGYINVEKLKNDLSKDTKYFNKKYVPDDEKLLGKDGGEFASFDLWDVKSLVKATSDTELKINFDLSTFIPLSFDLLFKHKKIIGTKTKTAKGHSSTAASSGHSSTAASSGRYSTAASSGHSSTAASSGHSSTAASSGHYSKAASSGHSSTAASSGDSSKAASSGDSSTAASSGHSSTAASSGDYSKAASSGRYSTAASSGHSSTAASSGHYSTAASSGHSSTAASSGHSSTAASSGDYSKAASLGWKSWAEAEGEETIACALGFESKAKGKIGTWLVLTEYAEDEKKILGIKSVKIDGKKVKEGIFYILKGGRFVESK